MAYRYMGDLQYISNLKTNSKYKSVKEVISKHINYLTNKSREDLLFHNIDKQHWFMVHDREKSKRIDASVAIKFVFAIPNQLKDDIDEMLKFIDEVMRFFNATYQVAIHFAKKENENLHVHIMMETRDKDTQKKLRLKKRDLSKFQKHYDNVVVKYTNEKIQNKEHRKRFSYQEYQRWLKEKEKKQIKKQQQEEKIKREIEEEYRKYKKWFDL